MLEGLIAPRLERFLGRYITDLPREQLRVALWSGVVRLEDVRLNPDAFDHLKLPFAVREGTIALLELKVSWKTALLRVHPIVVTLEGIAITASPRAEDEWAAEPAERRAMALKQAALAAAAEIAAQKRRGRGVEGVGSSVLEAMVPTILDRLRVKVGAVHVRFTDMPLDADGEDVPALGLRLDSLLLATSRVEREPEVDFDAASTPGNKQSDDRDGGGNASTSETTDTAERRAAHGRTRAPRSKSRDGKRGGKGRSRYNLRGLLAMVTPVGSARKRVEARGFRVYVHAPPEKVNKGNDGELESKPKRGPHWYPVPRDVTEVDGPTLHTRYDDDLDESDVVCGADEFAASLVVTARSRPPQTGEGLVERETTSGGGFSVRLEIETAVGIRVRPSQARGLIRLADAANVWRLREKNHGSSRPTTRGVKNWGDWWRYAGHAVMRANADAAASRSRSPSFASTVGVTRYEELYKRKILRELTAGGDASDAEDESFTDDEFFDCDDPSVLGEAGLELRALERRLTLEELLAARERAELSVYRDEEKDAFLDAEEEIDSDESSERGDATTQSGRSYVSWAAGALYRGGRGAVSGVIGLATAATAAAASVVEIALPSDASDYAAAARAAAFTLESRLVSLTLCGERASGPSSSASSSDSPSPSIRLDFRRVTAEMDAPDGVALRASVEDVEGWLAPADAASESSEETRTLWRRKDNSGGEDADAPAIRAMQLRHGSGGQDAAAGASYYEPLEMRVAPLNVLAHPSAAATLAPFGEEVAETHHERVLSSVQGLPGSAPRERLARAVASLDLQLFAPAWRFEASQPAIFIPGMSTDSCAAAIELTSLAVAYAPGGDRALAPAELEEVRAHAERLVERRGWEEENAVDDDVDDDERASADAEVEEALLALEEAATTHRVAMSFSGAAIRVPTLAVSSARAGAKAATVWSPLFESFEGSAVGVSKSANVGGPAAATRARVRLEPLRISLTPAVVAAAGLAAEAANAFAFASGDPSDAQSEKDTGGSIGSRAATDIAVSMAEVSVSGTGDGFPEYRAGVRQIEARVGVSREGAAWMDFEARSASVASEGRAIARVNASGSHPFVRAEGAVTPTSASSSGGSVALETSVSRLSVQACGVEAIVTNTLIAAAAEFVSAAGTARVELSSRPEAVDHAALCYFGKRGATRVSTRLFAGVGDARGEDPGAVRDAEWVSLGEPFRASAFDAFWADEAKSDDREGPQRPHATAACSFRSSTRIVLADDAGDSSGAVVGHHGVPVAVIDASGVAMTTTTTFLEWPGAPKTVADVDFERVRAWSPVDTRGSVPEAEAEPVLLSRVPAEPDERDAALLRFGARFKATLGANTSPEVRAHFPFLRMGAHVEPALGAARWAAAATAPLTSLSSSGGAATPKVVAASPEQALALTLDVAADATVYVPAPRIASASSASAGGRGFLVVFGAIRASAPGDSPAAVHIDGVRARARRVRTSAFASPRSSTRRRRTNFPASRRDSSRSRRPRFSSSRRFALRRPRWTDRPTPQTYLSFPSLPLRVPSRSPWTPRKLSRRTPRARRRRMSRKWRRLGASCRRGILLEAASPGAVRKSFSGRRFHPRTLRRRLRGSSPHHPGVAVSRSVSSDRTRAATRRRRRRRRRRF